MRARSRPTRASLPLAPAEISLRERYLEIANRLPRQEEAAEVVLAQAAKNAESPQPRAELLAEVAKIHEAGRMDRCETVQRQILDLAPEDPTIALPASRVLERIYLLTNRGQDLASVLRVQVKLEADAEVRRALLSRLGKLAEDTLKDDSGAIAAWKERLDEDPTDEEALVALDRLYERTGDKRALVEILKKREENASDPAQKRGFGERAAKLYVALGDVDEAIQSNRAILDDFGADRPTLAALAKLYEQAERWRDLESTFEADLGIATDAADRIALLTRMGDVRRKRLGELAGAIEAYRQALTIDPDAAEARSALEELLGDENARGEAAEILRPLYEASGANEKLLRVLDIQIELAERRSTAASISRPRGDRRRRRARRSAAGVRLYASRGLKESAAEGRRRRVDRARRAPRREGQSLAELVELYRAVAPDVLDEEKQVGVLTRIAELARTS